MQLEAPSRGRRKPTLTPMIDVVFLLLVFFMMTSELSEPDPFEVFPPVSAEQNDPTVQAVLYVSAEGRISFIGREGADAIAAVSEESDLAETVQVRADADLEATRLAVLLRDLSTAGLANVELVVTAP